MSKNLPGSRDPEHLSFVPPGLQLVMVLGLFVTARWAYLEAPMEAATDQWVYNALAAAAALAGILFLPFAIASGFQVLHDRRAHRRRSQPRPTGQQVPRLR